MRSVLRQDRDVQGRTEELSRDETLESSDHVHPVTPNWALLLRGHRWDNAQNPAGFRQRRRGHPGSGGCAVTVCAVMGCPASISFSNGSRRKS